MDLRSIVENFEVDSKLKSSKQLLSGHINVTQLIELENGSKYILQRINKYVFKKPVEVMENIINVTTFMKNRYISNNEDYSRHVLDFVKAKSGEYYFIDDEDEYWRMYKYIGNAETYYSSDDLEIVYEMGKAFGEFQETLQHFDASVLHETIPDFHNTIARFNNLKKSVSLDVCGRVSDVKEIVDEFLKLEPLAIKMTRMLNNRELPLRVTMNDTKCDNVLIDRDTHKGIAVIDLDTIMPGLVGFDFGDAIRSGTATAAEDEIDLSKVSCDIKRFEAFAKGFLSATKSFLTKNEKDTLVLGAFNMTIEVGSRFLTDYFDGDKYFRTAYDRHNLDRALNQLAMAKDILAKKDILERIVSENLID